MTGSWSRKNTYILGCLFLISFAFPYYAMLETREPVCIVVAVVLSLPIGHALLYSVQASLTPELFGTRLRYSGASIGYQLQAFRSRCQKPRVSSPALASGAAPGALDWLLRGSDTRLQLIPSRL